MIIEREGLKQICDEGPLEKIVDEVIAANPKQVEQFKAARRRYLGFWWGR